ncbi:SGNH/GDSL hydrolase family protein [Aquihabitans sp. McL0605]|uniref:SGNH/GDSL hydrolase family protein n=1 Tax=Aquihabitans sp. McL0605 TaxID=3415671 RepID=UPI003CEA9654
MRPHLLPVAAVLAAVLALAACSSGADASGPSTSSTTSTTVDDGPQITVRVVADSEVPDGVSRLLDQEHGIEVQSMSSTDGATMAELDPTVDAALAEQPDVLVYSGGTNDLKTGPLQMLSGVEERLGRWSKDACVVMAVPIFRYQRGTDAEVAERTKGTRLLEQGAAGAGAEVASYLDVSLAMDRKGEDFFAEGPLGDLHPGAAAYPGIADAIAAQVRACG